MKLIPSEDLSEAQVQRGLHLVIRDGLAAETMIVLTGGAFLTALALQLGASNFQIGVLAALPTFTNIFQLLAIWLVQRYRNRRAIAVVGGVLARFPLIMIGLLPWLFSGGASLYALISFLCFHYFFSSIVGASWNSWMKDLIPDRILGTYFSRRTRLCQTLNVTLSLLSALAVDYLKSHYPGSEVITYTAMFLLAGLAGMLGVWALARVPEPALQAVDENVFRQLRKPLQDVNFRNMLLFNACWIFALNLATPFFNVYMIQSLRLPLSGIIALGILSQVSSICAVSIWGRYIDRYSNKNILYICAPVYICCLLAWALTALIPSFTGIIALLILINIGTGVSNAGITLSLNNIGIKLAAKEQAMVYLTAKNMIIAFASAAAPLLGGLLADSFTSWQQTLTGPLQHLQTWNFFFVFSALFAILAMRMLRSVKETGEVSRNIITLRMIAGFRYRIKDVHSGQVLRRILYTPAKWKQPGERKKRA